MVAIAHALFIHWLHAASTLARSLRISRMRMYYHVYCIYTRFIMSHAKNKFKRSGWRWLSVITVICGITLVAWTFPVRCLMMILRFTGCATRVVHCGLANGLQIGVCTSLCHLLCLYKCVCACICTSIIITCAKAT